MPRINDEEETTCTRKRRRPKEIIFPIGLWDRVSQRAHIEGVPRAEVVRRAVRMYLRDYKADFLEAEYMARLDDFDG